MSRVRGTRWKNNKLCSFLLAPGRKKRRVEYRRPDIWRDLECVQMVIAVKVVVTVVHNHIAPLCGYLHRLAAGAVVVAKLLLGLAVPRLYFTLARPRQIECSKPTGWSILLARSFGPVPRFRLRSFRISDVILLAVASWWNSSSRFVRYQSVSRGLITTGEPGDRLTSVRAWYKPNWPRPRFPEKDETRCIPWIEQRLALLRSFPGLLKMEARYTGETELCAVCVDGRRVVSRSTQRREISL